MMRAGASVLPSILEAKRREIEALRRSEGRRRIEAGLEAASPVRGFVQALKKEWAGHRIIAEMKRKSPSRGDLAREYKPGRLAEAYEAGGAVALSVLTDSGFFGGDLGHLAEARAASSLPVLRKDFILDEIQVDEARAAGADALLLIASILDGERLSRLKARAEEMGMDALVEIHDPTELRRALEAGASLMGVNNRDLATFRVDLQVSLELAPVLPPGIVRVSESGIATRQDLEMLSAAGYDAFLIGEALMTGGDPVGRLKGWSA
jgi:indole-3-glycerol phosphate synthase